MRVTKDPETRREDILKAALELFREEGFEKVSVESITKAAGIAKGSFYNYFKTKEGVYEAVIADIASRYISTIKDFVTDENTKPKERLMTYIDWTFRLGEEQEKSLRRVLESNANPSQQQMYLRSLDEGFNLMLPFFVKLLEQGVTSKEFIVVNAHFTAVVMLGAFRSVQMAFYNGLQIDMTTCKTCLYDFLSRLLGTNF
jgi:AcrR family transcriptional regulator